MVKITVWGTVAHAYFRIGKPDAEIVALSEEIGAGLIVMGSRGVGGLSRVLIGSVADSPGFAAYRTGRRCSCCSGHQR